MIKTQRYIANPVVSCRDEGDDGALLFNPDIDDAILINPTGRIIWDILAKPYSISEIASYLSKETDTSEETIVLDVETFFHIMVPDFIIEVGLDAQDVQ